MERELGLVDAYILGLTERLGDAKVVTLNQRHFRAVRQPTPTPVSSVRSANRPAGAGRTIGASSVNFERTLLRLFVWPMHRLAMRLSGGRMGVTAPKPDGMGMLILTTVGRRSGARRETPIYFMPDGDRYVMVASNAGDASDPAWWLNLKASTSAEIRSPAGSLTVRAREAGEEERERLWPELVRRNPRFADYVGRTERHIPVVILEPI